MEVRGRVFGVEAAEEVAGGAVSYACPDMIKKIWRLGLQCAVVLCVGGHFGWM